MHGSRIPIAAAVLALGACGGGTGDPGDAVLALFEALQAGDGAGVVARMSESALAGMEDELEALKADPEASATQLSLMGVRVDAAELPDLTAAEFAEALFSSPMITAIVASGEVTVGEIALEGDTATVEVTTAVRDRTETRVIEVVLEDGAWKVTGFGMSF